MGHQRFQKENSGGENGEKDQEKPPSKTNYL